MTTDVGAGLRARASASPGLPGTSTAIWDFMRAVTRRGPLLWVLEDLHWGDPASVKLCDVALRELEDEPFGVLAFARPELHDIFPRLWAERNAQEVRLGPLSKRAAEAMVSAALRDPAAARQVAALVERAEGNAFFIEELIRAAVDGRSDTLPETVLGMVEARLSALPLEARRLLRAASVFGDRFCKGETIRRRRNNSEEFRNVGCCTRQPARQARGCRGSCTRPLARTRASASGRGSSTARLRIAASGARARGCGRSPSSSSTRRNSARPPSSTWRRS
ncbi:hypothetical protein WMF26_39120 [Sorangium sp. So ce185]|uniref:hypothetical protein n=1 Tax=Sorangium sp. So ce185 TaxID=3133287 RepID=UPI003F5D5659